MNHEEINKMYKESVQARLDLVASPDYKLCFNCGNVLPLDMFNVNPKKYQRPAAKGRGHVCVNCIKERNDG